jgi:hypothetical protein
MTLLKDRIVSYGSMRLFLVVDELVCQVFFAKQCGTASSTISRAAQDWAN